MLRRLFGLLGGGSKKKPTIDHAPSPLTANGPNAFFTSWLEGHGEANVIVDESGVGIAGNPTRLSYCVIGSEVFPNGCTVALEFHVNLPDGREIIEVVAGKQSSLPAAQEDAKLNFILSTFHVIYRCFLNVNDPHLPGETIILNDRSRLLVLGDAMTRSEGDIKSLDMSQMQRRFREMLTLLSLSPQEHWIKVIYGNHKSKCVTCAVTVDNEENPVLTAFVMELPWPKEEQFYMTKQFLIII